MIFFSNLLFAALKLFLQENVSNKVEMSHHTVAKLFFLGSENRN